MIFTEATLKGAFLLALERQQDERGFFARAWCEREAAAHGLNPRVAQCNISFNLRAGTIRGFHYQAPPHEEARLVRCTMGAVHDVIVDLRPDSPTFLRHSEVVLRAADRTAVYVPESFAHGFQTLEDDTEVFYQMSAAYVPESARGIRWNDPALDIRWPLPIACISERDRSFPDFRPPSGRPRR